MQQVQQIRGIVHVHTDCSRDGRLVPINIAEMCVRRGFSFAALSDHAEDMDSDKMSWLVNECEKLSNGHFALIPGLEHRFGHGVHILALGQRELLPPAPIIDTLEQLAREGCMLIAAHCTNSRHITDELLDILTAMEIWNVGRDTKYLPTSGYIRAYSACARARTDLFAIGGLDMHSGHEWGCEVITSAQCPVNSSAILSSLRSGQFHTRGRFISFQSKPLNGIRTLAFRAGDALVGVRRARDLARAMIGVK